MPISINIDPTGLEGEFKTGEILIRPHYRDTQY